MVLDILILLIIAWAAYKGFTKGLIVQAATLAALVLGIYGATHFSWYTAGLMHQHLSLKSDYMPLLAFILTFIGIVVLVHLLAKLLDKLLQAIALGFINRLTGAVFSILKMTLILSVLFMVLNTINAHISFLPAKEVAQSRLYAPISRLVPSIFPMLRFDGEFPLRDHNKSSNSSGDLQTALPFDISGRKSDKLKLISLPTDFFS